MTPRGLACGKLDVRNFRDLPDCYTGDAADLLGDLCRVRISLERNDDLCALRRRKPFSISCCGKLDACSHIFAKGAHRALDHVIRAQRPLVTIHQQAECRSLRTT